MQQQRRLASIVLLMLCAVIRVSAQGSYNDRAQKYVEQYKEWAMAEQRRTGVPAAITLAQGIHETSGGQSELAENANNHFGIKCKKEWTGDTYRYTDDAPNECFRKYESVLNSYKDHSDYLSTGPRYAALFKLDVKDYKGWANGLKRCGYATNPRYAAILIKLVEEHGLNDFTIAAATPPAENPYQQKEAVKQPEVRTAAVKKEAPIQKEIVPEQDAPQPVATAPVASSPVIAGSTDVQVSMGKKNRAQAPIEQQKTLPEIAPTQQQPVSTTTATDGKTVAYGELTRSLDLKAFFAKKGTVLLGESIKYDIRYAKLLELNDLPDAPLEADMYIYLEKKHTTGEHSTYTVKEGETLTQIAQIEGIQLKYLKAYNKIGGNEEPVVGAVLQLMDYATAKPATRPRAVAPGQKQAVAMKDDIGKKVPTDESAFIAKSELGAGKKEMRAAKKEEIAAIKKQAKEQPAKETKTKEADAPVLAQTKTDNESATEPATTTNISNETVATTEPVTTPAADTTTMTYTEVAVSDSTTTMVVPQEEEVDIASDTTIEDLIKLAHEEAGSEADDEFTKLKKKLDKVVYASDKAVASNDELKKEAKQIQKDVKEGKASVYYTVKKGDTAFSIAKKHKLSMKQLMSMNDLDFKSVKPGTQLRVK